MKRHRRTSLVTACTIAVLAACSPTTYDGTASTAPEADGATTTSLPTGTAAELLPAMLVEVQGLALRVMNADDDGAAATRIEQLWAAVRPEIESTEPDLVPDFEFVVRRCRAAADRNRPADADRAFKNLSTLVDAYLG